MWKTKKTLEKSGTDAKIYLWWQCVSAHFQAQTRRQMSQIKLSPAKQTDPGFLSGLSYFSSSPPVVKQTVGRNSSSSSSSHRQVQCENPALRQNRSKEKHTVNDSTAGAISQFPLWVFFLNLEPPARCGIIILLAGKLNVWTSTRQDRLGWAAGPGSALPRC